ncbi:MAG: hypothetical protein UU48_C0004G0052 [Candidatus Uhrbacteria bacterium GW2011_GWF2_41_16]|uniref:Uncharacterized protein n=1 Tax=Candidatus Uhrbacteria bacterium GW2011_GWF2_41_16 TaxID=1618997 RepID=A0A0G0VBJ3_9BACT|nr:MAG: hypothetical protein UU48_C0004G0052 [Candidatus Uhrbacteria bacterium GW2011_GWF2_41_16]HBP00417.1 hypothetical protein [Candidatus Uhrbacteria bacterium]
MRDLAGALFSILSFAPINLMISEKWRDLLFAQENGLRERGVTATIQRGIVTFVIGDGDKKVTVGFGRTSERFGLEEMKIVFEGNDHFIDQGRTFSARHLFAEILNKGLV